MSELTGWLVNATVGDRFTAPVPFPPELNGGSGLLPAFCGWRPFVWTTKSLALLFVSWPLPRLRSAPLARLAAVDVALAFRSTLLLLAVVPWLDVGEPSG